VTTEPPVDVEYAARCAARLVGALYDLDPADFTGARKGPAEHVHARQAMMYLLHTEADVGLLATAKALGRHHSTVWHAVGVVTALREHPDVDEAFTRLGATFREFLEAHARLPALVESLAA
jgi:chromosomal replication initiation ATPase DnaA